MARAPYVHGKLNLADAVSASPATGSWVADAEIALNNYSYHTLTVDLCPTGLD